MHEIGNSVPPEVPCQGQLATLGTGRVGALRDVGVTEVPHPSKVGTLEIVRPSYTSANHHSRRLDRLVSRGRVFIPYENAVPESVQTDRMSEHRRPIHR